MDLVAVPRWWLWASNDVPASTAVDDDAVDDDAFVVRGSLGARGPIDPGPVLELESTHGQALFGFVRRLGLTDQQAADCVQEVLTRLWAELDRGTAILDHKAWAFRSIYRLAMDEYRLRRRVSDIVGRLGRSTPPGTGSSRDDLIAVWSEVDRLPSRQRQVVYLRYRADLTFDEIATTLGITSSAARSHATQAMARLRARLEPSEPERDRG